MTTRIVTSGALRQISDIHDYVARDSPEAAQRVVDRIHKIIALVTERPRIGHKMRERGVRMYVVKPYPYIVFYRYSARTDTVRIIRVRHGAMRRGALQDEPAEFRAAVS
jgi:plasmid stabilization system protein ParE